MFTSEQIDIVKNNLSPINTAQAFADSLDELYDDMTICGIGGYQASKALNIVDPIAFNCAENDYIDMMCSDGVWVEVSGEYFDANEVEQLLNIED